MPGPLTAGRLSLILVCACLQADCVAGQRLALPSGNGRISGRVLSSSAEPIEGAMVTLMEHGASGREWPPPPRISDPPFTVAFGSAGMAGADRASGGLETVIDRERGLGLIEAAQASNVFVLGGESRLEPPAPPLPWRTWLLWAVLVVGVGLLGWMVRRLSGQVQPS